MSDYRIEKIRRRLLVILDGGDRIEGDVFLQPSVRYRPGPEAPIELLNDPDAFFPLAHPGQSPLMIAKDHVVRVEYSGEDVDTLPGLETPGVSLDFLLSDGTTVSGTVHPEYRAERPRVLDFLNMYVGRFIPVSTGEVTSLIRRGAIIRVRERR
ncbi:MAG TPA: hypothetical protein VMH39_03465 [Gemmatimonadaceae bacterium]|nr:hypothetical protein [Gemmatimonadaceae bacterium]